LNSQHAFRLLLIVAVIVGAVALAAALSPGIRPTTAQWIGAIPPIVILALGVMRLAVSTKPLGAMAKQLAVILAVGVVLVAGYSYRNDFRGLTNRLAGNLIPSRGVEVAPGVLRFTADDGGQFAIDANVDDVPVHFMMDTGASGVILSKADALRLGLNPQSLSYTAQFSTANGLVRAAPVKLGTLQIGSLRTEGVSAWVNEGDLDQSLLGMTYLSTLGRIEIKGDTLILER
jgi:aspartyl protease family protein